MVLRLVRGEKVILPLNHEKPIITVEIPLLPAIHPQEILNRKRLTQSTSGARNGVCCEKEL